MKFSHRTLFAIVATALLTATFALNTFAQANHTALVGRVIDRTGAAVTGATVTLQQQTIASERRVETNDEGAFSFDAVANGRYVLSVTGGDFATFTEEFVVNDGERRDLRITLDARRVAEEVTVTATRSVETIGTLPGAITIVGREQLDQQAQVSTGIADALGKVVPGLAPSNQSLSIFGQTLRGRPFQVLIDGIPQSTTRNVQRDLETIDRASIERVEVLRGPTAIYGDGATGGIVNIITRTPTDERLRFSTEVGANFSLTNPSGSLGGYLRQSVAGKRGRFDFTTSATVESVGSFFDADGDRIPPDPHGQGGINDSRLLNFFGKFGARLTPQQRLQFTASIFDLNQNTAYTTDPSVNSLPGRQRARALRGLSLEEQQGSRNTFFNLGYTNNRLFDSRSRLHAQIYYRDFFTRFFPFDGRAFASFGNQITQSFVDSLKRGGRLEVETPVVGATRLTLLYGADYSSESTAQPVTISDPTAFTESGGLVFRTIGGARTFTPAIAQRNFGVFLQTEYRALENLILRGGIRHERIDASIPDFTTLGGNFIPGGNLDYSATLFNAGGVYQFTDTFSFFANFAQGFSIADIGRTLRAAPRGFTVNTLRPEAQKVNNYETGVRYLRGNLQSSLALFYNTSNLGTTFAPDLSIIRAPERVYGAELEMDAQPFTRFRFGGAASWLEGENDSDRDGDFTYLPGDRVPPIKLTAYAEYDFTQRFRTRLQTLYSGNRNRFGNALVFGRAPVEDYAMVDLSGSLRLTRGTFRFGVENLFNKLYFPPISQWYATDANRAAGRGATASIGYTIDY